MTNKSSCLVFAVFNIKLNLNIITVDIYKRLDSVAVTNDPSLLRQRIVFGLIIEHPERYSMSSEQLLTAIQAAEDVERTYLRIIEVLPKDEQVIVRRYLNWGSSLVGAIKEAATFAKINTLGDEVRKQILASCKAGYSSFRSALKNAIYDL